MQKTVARALALSLIVGLAACGVRRLDAAPEAGSPVLPVGGPSWVAGDRAAPEAGRIVVGLLVNRRAPRRLASLVPKAKLDRYLKQGETLEPIVEEYGAWRGPSYHTWGPQGLHLALIRDDFRKQQNIEVEFREVLANECHGLPLVLAERLPVGNHERRPLVAYKRSGGRLLIPTELFFPEKREKNVRKEDKVRIALRSVIQDSPLVHALARDPFALKARRDGEDLLIDAPQLGLRFRLEDGSGTTVRQAVAEGGTTARLKAPDPGLNPFAHTVRATWTGQGLTLHRGWSVADLVGTLEREVYAAKQIHAGGVLALRIRARLSHDSTPLADQTGRVTLRIAGEEIAAVDYRTGPDGLAHPRLHVPAGAAPGQAEVAVDDIRWPVQIAPGIRVSVVSDRPLYKQSDTVHVRAMVHRAGDGRPVADAKIQLSVGDAKRIVQTSAHGIASHTFALQDQAVGWLPVRAAAGGATGQSRIRIKAFERPTFTLAAEPSTLRLGPGQTAPVTVTATYVNGSPLVGGRFAVDDAKGVRVLDAPEQTGTDGGVTFDVQARREGLRGGVVVSVQDADGRRAELTLPVAIESDAVRLGVEALSDLAVGVPARFLITASEPTTVSLGGAMEGPREVSIDASGRALVTLTPIRASHTLRVIAKGSGASVEYRVQAGVASEDAYVLALDRRAAQVGEAVKATLLGPDGVVELDAWKDATPIFTTSVTVQNGRAEVTLPLDASMAGVLRLHTHNPDRTKTAPRATLLVTRGRALDVSATPQKASYVPGATADVDVTVRDKAGKPTSAVLGYWGVDEALLALAPMTEGHERVFDTLGSAPSAARLDLAEQVDRNQAVARRTVTKGFGDLHKGAKAVRTFPVVLARTPTLRKLAEQAREARVWKHLDLLYKSYVGAWADIPLTELVSADTLRETIQWLAARGTFDAELLKDPWGKPFQLWTDRNNLDIHWRSAGPDGRFHSADDITRPWSGTWVYEGLPQRVRDFHAFVRANHDPARVRPVVEDPIIKDEELFDHVETDSDAPFVESTSARAAEIARRQRVLEAEMADMGAAAPMPGAAFDGPGTNGTIGLGGGGGGSFRGRGGSKSLIASGSGRTQPPPYVRRDFDPTLCFIPEAIVGPDGKTTLTIPLKDSMTTWRLRLVASNAEGATGIGYGSIRVKQPVHATPWLSPHLTAGDVVEVPVAIRNEEATAVTARVTATASAHLAELSKPSVTVEVDAGGTARATFRYRAQEAGRATVRITVDTGAAQDVQERVVVVHRNARTVVAVASGNVIADAPMPTEMPGDGPGEVRMDLYPSPLADVQSGFDGLIAAPHG